mmetsp:Transcript_1383/g.3068  ORF Transcript_1383/g.3068 Transcript_1383/m.3068 type:complete len:225 (-) Transcript_1383:580-1254(-)
MLCPYTFLFVDIVGTVIRGQFQCFPLVRVVIPDTRHSPTIPQIGAGDGPRSNIDKASNGTRSRKVHGWCLWSGSRSSSSSSTSPINPRTLFLQLCHVMIVRTIGLGKGRMKRSRFGCRLIDGLSKLIKDNSLTKVCRGGSPVSIKYAGPNKVLSHHDRGPIFGRLIGRVGTPMQGDVGKRFHFGRLFVYIQSVLGCRKGRRRQDLGVWLLNDLDGSRIGTFRLV